MIKKLVVIFGFLFILLGCKQEASSIDKIDSRPTNDLINETSPYLLQHAYNPVDWKAWNAETLAKAKAENKLIVISVGYSACHWCHVMEEESFENDSVAKLMNEKFINIKVDREERPDVDQVYVNAVTLMTGSAGWPLNVIALPDGRPVFGGTYFSKDQWLKVLEQTSSLYDKEPSEMIAYADRLTEGVKQSDLIEVKKETSPYEVANLVAIVDSLKTNFDLDLGGLKKAPKFPMPSHLSFALRYAHQLDDKDLMAYVETTLNKMSSGGLYDQLAGGFSRYSVDDRWHVPHFEKMLYDNAQLVSLYAEAFQLTNNEEYKRIIIETLDFIAKEMTSSEGTFYSSIDADSENADGELEEGVYYTWTEAKLQELLAEDYALFKSYYNINSNGLWENGQYVLLITQSDKDFLKASNIAQDELNTKLKTWKALLLSEREKRNKPRLDQKALTSWNALMIKAYIDAYKALGDENYLQVAKTNALFIKEKQIQPNGSLWHSYKDGESTILGFAEDYAHVVSAYIDLYQVTMDRSWLDLAKTLMDYSLANFQNPENGMFYFTSNENSNLIARKLEIYDNVIPSSNSVQAINLFKLGLYFYDKSYSEMANQMLANISEDIASAPTAFTNWLELYLNYTKPFYEVAIIGPEAEMKLKDLNSHYLPNIIVAGSTIDDELPLLINKFTEDNTSIYVCVNGTCKLPVAEVDVALNQIKR
ncbi:thioredoxin domain-containing protein [Winogradskyella poriferorum]|uniref:thioredoxin domain-containing protein n=1 Tax=Winogradskyella poriferorum TaxID=307627 RepID=UPI003D65FBDF